MTVESYLAPLTRAGPLGRAGTLRALPDGVQVTPRPFVAMADLRVDPSGPAAAAVAEYLGVAPPTTPSTYVESETATAIWLGPDEWLITSPSGPRRSWRPGCGR